jgi:predicted nucleic acid-binding protein
VRSLTAGTGRSLPGRRPEAVLETSGWVAACRAEVAANLLDLFCLVVPEAVEQELSAADPAVPLREHPYAILFRHLRPRMTRVPAAAGPTPLPILGTGEAAAVALARARGSLLLVNERPAAAYAANLGVGVVTIPTVVVRLHLGGAISRRAAHRKLDLLQGVSPGHIDARRLVDAAGLA